MSFDINFDPLDDREIELAKLEHLTPHGYYNFLVKNYSKKVHPVSGNVVVSVTFTYWDHNGVEKMAFDNFVFVRKMMGKIKNYCIATGQLDAYNKGQFGSDVFDSRTGVFELGMEGERTDKKTGKVYAPRNVVLDYVINVQVTKAEEEFKDDEIPF